MSQTWYYARGNQQFGPVTIEQLQGLIGTGQVQRADLVWREGMAQWTPAQNVPELTPQAAASPIPPVPPAAPSPGFATAAPNPQQTSTPPWPASPQPVGTLGYQNAYEAGTMYAGFWMRFAAYIIDSIIVRIGATIVGFIIGFALAIVAGHRAQGVAEFFGGAAGLILGWLYFAMLESSPKQATLGKQAVGIKEIDMNGGRISFGQATGRFFGKIISAIIFCIGFMMAGWTERKQALHDMMASTLVVKRS
jgi:uncharacterized RDD family membrane protein YckC